MSTSTNTPVSATPPTPTDGSTASTAPVNMHPATLLAPASAPPAHRNFLHSSLHVLEEVGTGIETGVIDIAIVVKNMPSLLRAWAQLAPEVKTVAIQIAHDVMTCIADGVADAAAIRTGNLPTAIALSSATWGAIQQLFADALVDEKPLVASFKVLGVDIEGLVKEVRAHDPSALAEVTAPAPAPATPTATTSTGAASVSDSSEPSSTPTTAG